MFKIVTDLHLSRPNLPLVQEEGKKALQSKAAKHGSARSMFPKTRKTRRTGAGY